jgi:hypothetical protein
LGAREYQSIYDATQIGSLGSVDLAKMKVDGGLHPEPLTAARQRAAKRLRSVDGALLHHHGVEGLSLTRAVLSDRQSVEGAARLRGARNDRETRSWCWLFRRCLDVIAKVLGFATTVRPPRHVPLESDNPSADPARHANASELGDPEMRRGRRANGHG